MTIVGIHQPNYMPWLGYFAKMARSDIFVFLDDVQFSKGSYTNRVQVGGTGAEWLTVPVRVNLGDAIDAIRIARPDWVRAHCDRLRQLYRSAACFDETWPEIEAWFGECIEDVLHIVNARLIRRMASRLGIRTRMLASSEIGMATAAADERLAEIVARLAPGGVYLSGAGGAKYQSAATFASRGVALVTSDFRPAPYPRGDAPFLPGLSVLDAVFHLGWDQTTALVTPS